MWRSALWLGLPTRRPTSVRQQECYIASHIRLAFAVVDSERLSGFDECGDKGTPVNTTGDGMLIEFASAVQSVSSAVGLQRRVAEQDATIPLDRRIELR